MNKLLQNIFFVVFISNPQLLSQQFSPGSPEWLVDMFFSKSSFPDKVNYFTGEMVQDSDQKTIGEELNGEGEVSFHQIRATNSTCVFAVEVETDKKTIDFYCYLVNDANIWKMTAVRRFLLPSFIYTVRDSLLILNTLSSNDSVFLLSLQLFTASDVELKNYFSSNLDKFKELILLFNKNEKDKADIALASVGCNAIYVDRTYPGCVFIQILKFESMEAGFIQAADSNQLPEISVESFIYIEEVSAGWFVYRTI
jgi:hypothetical protein